MRIFRIILLGCAMCLFVMNFLTIDYDALGSARSIWAYFRILLSLLLVLLLLGMVKKDRKRQKARS